MSRSEGIKLVRDYDHVLPKDLYRWLDYVQMNEEDFHRIADHFRDPRVWSIDESGSFMKVSLTNNDYESYFSKIFFEWGSRRVVQS